MRLKVCLVVCFLLFATLVDSKRSGGSRGRSRGSSSSGSTSFWTRKSNRKSSSEPKPAPSAPKEPEIKKQTANVQQSSSSQNSGRPIGWNVDNSAVQKQNVNPSHTAPNPQNGGYGYGQHNTGGYSGYGAPQGPPPPYPGHNAPPAYPGYNNPPPPYPGHNNPPPPYPGYNQHMGGYGGYPQQTPGLMGGYQKGYGGYGGFGGSGNYGYGMKKSGGFLGKHAFRNVLGGLFVWYLVSGLMNKPYKVYNYYNQPDIKHEEITLPPNILTLCSENATNICAPGTAAICTQDERILCVVSMNAVTPCQDDGNLCVNSTIPCLDTNDPLCQNKTTVDNATVVNLPCFTNMTLQSSAPLPANVTLPSSENNQFCVTTMAVPDSSIPANNGTVPEMSQMLPNNSGSVLTSPPNVTNLEGFNDTLPVNL